MRDDELLLKAALCSQEQALQAWLDLLGGRGFDSLDGKAYRALPTVYTNLRPLDAKVPCLKQLKGTARHAWAQNIPRLRALLPLLQRLNEEKLDYRLLKGAAIACLTDSWSTRVMGDVDILFDKKDSPRILAALKSLGAKQKFNLSKNYTPTLHETWSLTTHHYATDLDIHLARPTDQNIFGRMLDCEAKIVPHEDVSIRIPSVEWLLIHSALHGKLEIGRSDSLQSILDAARLLPLADLNILKKNAADIDAVDIVEWTLRALPVPSPEITQFLENLQHANLKNNRKRHLRRLLSKNTLTLHNVKKLLNRRAGGRLLKAARMETKGKKWLYWGWLQLGQLNAFEHMCIEKWGGFLDLPATAIGKGEIITVIPKSAAPADQPLTMGSIMSHDFRVKIRLPEGVRQLTVFLEYRFSFATHLALYINGNPMGTLPLPRVRSGVFPVTAKDNSLEISLRSPCNQNEDAIDFIGIRCDWT